MGAAQRDGAELDRVSGKVSLSGKLNVWSVSRGWKCLYSRNGECERGMESSFGAGAARDQVLVLLGDHTLDR